MSKSPEENGVVVAFRPRDGRQVRRDALVAERGVVLLFTGVRYERVAARVGGPVAEPARSVAEA